MTTGHRVAPVDYQQTSAASRSILPYSIRLLITYVSTTGCCPRDYHWLALTFWHSWVIQTVIHGSSKNTSKKLAIDPLSFQPTSKRPVARVPLPRTLQSLSGDLQSPIWARQSTISDHIPVKFKFYTRTQNTNLSRPWVEGSLANSAVEPLITVCRGSPANQSNPPMTLPYLPIFC